MTLEHLKEKYGFFEKGPSIIVVGPDRVGKTTIVDLMSRIMNVPKFKCPAEKQIFKEGGRQSLAFDYTLTHFIAQTGYRMISDRGYICEAVYSGVFKRQTDMELLSKIDEAHANLGTKILYLYSSEIPDEEDDLVPKDRYWDVVRGYDTVCSLSNCIVKKYDTVEMLKAYKDGGDISVKVADECMKLMGV